MIAGVSLPNFPANAGIVPSASQAVGKTASSDSPLPYRPIFPSPDEPETNAGESKPAAGSPPSNLLGRDTLLFLQEEPQNTDDQNGSEENELDSGIAKTYTELSPEERQEVNDLRARDREVRAHERAHQSAAGQYAGAASFEFEPGPDGQRYAVSGEVLIDVSPAADPQATIDKMAIIRRAALAPGNPSAQDHAVAAQADQNIREARVEQQRDATEKPTNDENGDATAEAETLEANTDNAASGYVVGEKPDNRNSNDNPSTPLTQPQNSFETVDYAGRPESTFTTPRNNQATGPIDAFQPIDTFVGAGTA